MTPKHVDKECIITKDSIKIIFFSRVFFPRFHELNEFWKLAIFICMWASPCSRSVLKYERRRKYVPPKHYYSICSLSKSEHDVATQKTNFNIIIEVRTSSHAQIF
jgi:hypothetical protein